MPQRRSAAAVLVTAAAAWCALHGADLAEAVLPLHAQTDASVAPATLSATLSATAPTQLLHPGSSATATVTVRNDNAVAVVVTRIGSGASVASGPCPAGAVTSAPVQDLTGLLQQDGTSKTIAPHTTASYGLALVLGAPVPDGCQGQTLSLSAAVDVRAAS